MPKNSRITNLVIFEQKLTALKCEVEDLEETFREIFSEELEKND